MDSMNREANGRSLEGMNPEKTRYTVPCMFGKSISEPLIAEVPGSKSITNRALLLATLADGKSTLQGALFSDDSRHFLKCIQELGFEAYENEKERRIEIIGQGGRIQRKEASIYVGREGPAARLLTA